MAIIRDMAIFVLTTTITLDDTTDYFTPLHMHAGPVIIHPPTRLVLH